MTRREFMAKSAGAAAMLPTIPRVLKARNRPLIPVRVLSPRRCDPHRNLRKLMRHATYSHTKWVPIVQGSITRSFQREVYVYFSGATHDVADAIIPIGQTCYVILPWDDCSSRLWLACKDWTNSRLDNFDVKLTFIGRDACSGREAENRDQG